MLEYDPNKMGEIIDSLRDRMGKWESDITYKDIYEEIGLPAPDFAKKKNGKTPFTVQEIVDLANFFHITVDEMLTGIAPENTELYQYIPLSNASLDWIKKTQAEEPDLLRILDLILSNEAIVRQLLGSIQLYINYSMFKIESLLENSECEIIDSESSKELMLSISERIIIDLLEDIRLKWEKRYNGYVYSNRRLNSKLRTLKVSRETKYRLLYKDSQKHRPFDVGKELRLMRKFKSISINNQQKKK